MKNFLESFLGCRRLLARMVGRIVRPEEIEDIVQEAFVMSYAASRTQEIHNPQAFMMRVARNIAMDHVGKAEHKLNCSLEDIDETDLVSDMDTEISCQSQEKFLEFCRAVSDLPTSCRRVFILKKVYGLSLQEISTHLGISVSTAEKHVAKGLSIVMEHMVRSGHTAGKSVPLRKKEVGGE
ncbi:MAG: sigma-70 family RNA polymerase sigma factor [Pseudomonadota bacterium]